MLRIFADLWRQAPVWRYTTVLAMLFTPLVILWVPNPGPKPTLKKPIFLKNEIHLEWSSMRGFQGSYIVKRKNNFFYKEVSTNISDLKFNDPNIKFGEKYTYKIEAIDGNKKVESNPMDIEIPTPSFKITSFKIDVETPQTSDAVTLKFRWEGQGSLNLDGVREFVLYENGLPISRISSPTTNYEHKLGSSNCGEQYAYRLMPELVDGKTGEAREQKYSLPLPKPGNLDIDFSSSTKPKLTWKWPDQCKHLVKNFEIRRDNIVISTTAQNEYDIHESQFCVPITYSVRAKGNDDSFGLPANKDFFVYKKFGKLINSKCKSIGGDWEILWEPIRDTISENCSFRAYKIDGQNGDNWENVGNIGEFDKNYYTIEIKNSAYSRFRLYIINKNDQPGEETIINISNDRCEIK